MAETAPLTAAYTHAQKAADETQAVHWPQAAEEHRVAATEYARAARTTGDAEALRILKLLEEQHDRLAQIVSAHGFTSDTDSHMGKAEPTRTVAIAKDSTLSHQPASPSNSQKPAPLSHTRFEAPERSASQSLARDIASRRGIPQLESMTRPSAAAQARVRHLSPESRRRSSPAAPSKIPPSIVDSQHNHTRTITRQESDDGFAKFYNNLTTGTISKLSSVLAYAGLPLSVEDQPQETVGTRKPLSKNAASDTEPDVKKLFSKAALSALEDEHRQRGTLGHGFGPAESFYVVPQTGGTTAYADIVKLQQPQHHTTSSLGEHEEFVDASETPGPPSPKYSRRNTLQGARGPFNGSTQTSEELELENATLKSTLEQLASRLANFEAHAQDASMAFLTQSMVGQRPGSSSGAKNSRPSGAVSDNALQERVHQLEKQVERQAEDEQRLRDLAAKQEKALKKWDKRFEVLNARAKEKKQAKEEREKASEIVDGSGSAIPNDDIANT